MNTNGTTKQISPSIDETRPISLFFPNGDEYKLTPISGDEMDFIHPNTGVKVSFIKNDDFRSFTIYGQTASKLKLNIDTN